MTDDTEALSEKFRRLLTEQYELGFKRGQAAALVAAEHSREEPPMNNTRALREEKKMPEIVPINSECFGHEDGSVICWRGVNYTPQRMTLRVRLHNLIVGFRNRRV